MFREIKGLVMGINLFRLGFIILTLINSSCTLLSPTHGIYLIPKGYTGDVIIVFNQADGVVPEVENGLFVYKIPEGGILKVKTPGKAGIVNVSYFYVDNNNERREIKYLRITGDRSPAGAPQNKFGDIGQQAYESGTFIMSAGG